MNPIPITWCLAGAVAAALLGAIGGWTVRDWKRDSEVLAGIKEVTEQVRKQADRIDKSATIYEQEKPDAQSRDDARTNTLREIYRDRVVPADCATPDAAVRVLADAVADANARAAGEPASGLPAAAASPGAADRP